MQYILSDTHFDHANIIEYCDRPFDSVEEMNETLLYNWNSTIDCGDEVIFLGDLTIAGTAEAFLRWIERLNGDITFVVGDHDTEVLRTLENITICEYFHLRYNGYQFYCVHDPADGPRNPEQWVIHGHHHNNWPQQFPFVNPHGRLVNVSTELLNYRPLALPDLVEYIERGEWLERVDT